MSRPFRLLTLSLTGLSLTVAGCHTSTPYTRMYSPRKSYYVAPVSKSDKTAEELLKATEAAKLPGPTPEAAPGGLPPAAPPAADPLAPPPAVPAPATPPN